jgi:ABC-type transport system substrate-binding protein
LDKGISILGNLTGGQFFPSIQIPADYLDALNAANMEPDIAKREAMFRDVMKIITDKYCMAIPLYLQNFLAAVNTQVHDLNINVLAGHLWNPENAWLSQ